MVSMNAELKLASLIITRSILHHLWITHDTSIASSMHVLVDVKVEGKMRTKSHSNIASVIVPHYIMQ